MKSFWQKHWKWLVPTLTAAAALIVAVSLYFLGFRITYDPTIITNWDAVSGCAAWAGLLVSAAGVVVSACAVHVAITIPKKIADKQVQIELFDKRYKVAYELNRYLYFGHSINKLKSSEEIRTQAELCFETELDAWENLKDTLSKSYVELLQLMFLFPGIEADDCSNLIASSSDVLFNAVVERKYDKKCIERFSSIVDEFEEKYMPLLRDAFNNN